MTLPTVNLRFRHPQEFDEPGRVRRGVSPEYHWVKDCAIRRFRRGGPPDQEDPAFWPRWFRHRGPPQPTRWTGRLAGRCDVRDADLAGFELFRSTDGSHPDLLGTPYETYTSKPHATAAQPLSTELRFVERYRNAYGITSQDTLEYSLETDGAGAAVPVSPSPPSFEAFASADRRIRVVATYNWMGDGDYAADTWLGYFKDGEPPVPGVDSPTEWGMRRSGGVDRLEVTPTTQWTAGHTIYVLLQARRSGSPDVDSENAVPVTVEIYAPGGGGPEPPGFAREASYYDGA